MGSDYLYEVLVHIVSDGNRKYIGQYYTNAAPPAIGTLFNPKHLSRGITIPEIDIWKDFKVIGVKMTPIEITEVPYVGDACDLTYIDIEIAAVDEVKAG